MSDPPTHHKTVTDNGDGTYDVTLTVTGEEATKTTTTKQPVDVVIVFDRSDSMRLSITAGSSTSGTTETDTNKKRLSVAKSATETLINGLYSSTDIDARVAVVDFATYTRVHTSSGGTSMDAADAAWYSSATDANAAVESIKNPSGDNVVGMSQNNIKGMTNWEDALTVAKSVSDTGSGQVDAKKYVVFVTDGNPTLRNTYDGNDTTDLGYNAYGQKVANISYSWYWYNQAYYGKGDSGHLSYSQNYYSGADYYGTGKDDSKGYNYKEGVKAGKAIVDGGATLYGVGLSPDISSDKMTSFGKDTGAAATFSASNKNDLISAFSDIAAQITATTKTLYTDVTISDTLSEWAEFDLDSDGVESYTCTKTDADGNVTTLTDQAVTIDYDTGTVTWDVTDGSGTDKTLEEGATYSITFTIRPNQAAFDRQADIENGDDEADTGTNWNTSTESVDTVTGIYSNDFGSDDTTEENTYVQWREVTQTTSSDGTSGTTVSDDVGYDGYEHPVMEVPTSTITVNKVWSDGADAHTGDSITVKLLDEDGNAVTDSSGAEVTVTLDKDNGWSATFDYALSAGPDGHSYSVQEVTDDLDDYTPSYDYAITSSPKYDWETTVSSVTSDSNGTETGVKLQGRKAQAGKATVTNTLNPYSLQVVKKGKLDGEDDADATALEGAGFTLYEATVDDDNAVTVGNQVGTEQTSDENGELKFGGTNGVLTPGETYVLEETTTPNGYVTSNPYVLVVADDGTVTLYETTVNGSTITKATSGSTLSTVSNDTSTYTMTVVNTMEEYDLPSAGGTGSFPFAATGLAIAVMAAGALFARRRLLS
ncbi:MAG: DUF7604 domain-containing protein [Coriobacteriales bacterium]